MPVTFRRGNGSVSKPESWAPCWDNVVASAKTMCKKHLWRVSPLHDFDDLLQEARVAFLICQDRYPRVTEARHFYSLWRRAFNNTITELARRARVTISGMSDAPDGDGGTISIFDAVPAAPAWGYERFQASVAAAPDPVRRLLAVTDLKGRPRRHKGHPAGGRETTNEYLCRMAGLDPKTTNLRGMLDDVIQQAP